MGIWAARCAVVLGCGPKLLPDFFPSRCSGMSEERKRRILKYALDFLRCNLQADVDESLEASEDVLENEINEVIELLGLDDEQGF
jgi:hypothetical protein